jgi:DNA-binding beta-propeller fold protein YncE
LSRKKTFAIALAVVLPIVAILPFRVEIRKAWRHAHPRHAESKGMLHNPEAMCFGWDGTIYVGNQDSGDITVLNPDGSFRSSFAKVEGYVNGDGVPSNICRGLYMHCTAPGRLLFTAYHNAVEIDVSGPTPKLVRIIGKKRGSGPGEMDGPEGISKDTNGDIYITDEHNRRINVFKEDGTYIRSLPLTQDPQYVLVHGDRLYYTLNKRNYAVCTTKEGKELFRLGHEALFPLFCYIGIPASVVAFVILTAMKRPGQGLLAALALGTLTALACGWDYHRHSQPGDSRRPDCITASPDGERMYITDRDNGRIQVYDREGKFLFCFGSEGSGPGQLLDPIQTVFDKEGRLWVCDSDNHRLSVFTADGKFVKFVQ